MSQELERQPAEAVEVAIEDPTRLLRLTGMVRELRTEVARLPLDESGRTRLAQIHREILDQLRDLVSDDLRKEIESFSIRADGAPSESEVRLAQAQLAGWLEGLFAGLNAAMWNQQMQTLAAQQASAEQQRIEREKQEERSSGQYL